MVGREVGKPKFLLDSWLSLVASHSAHGMRKLACRRVRTPQCRLSFLSAVMS